MQTEKHYNIKSGWIRAAVLGANDGILSTSSLAVGVAAAGSMRQPVVLAALAGIVAGALSMAAGEYVSVSSQADIEHADLQREKEELASMPEAELDRYITRLGPVGLIVKDMDGPARAEVMRKVRAAFDPWVEGGNVRFTAACWSIHARA